MEACERYCAHSARLSGGCTLRPRLHVRAQRAAAPVGALPLTWLQMSPIGDVGEEEEFHDEGQGEQLPPAPAALV